MLKKRIAEEQIGFALRQALFGIRLMPLRLWMR